ncbi:hypothetical protein AXA84_0109 [Candidatus Phytoplasma oryzae]|uniref:DUF4194 domain-containing protein n=1 Tax=Candidatus Phytoplasma oryzae TaxID=203274 RepID=A0A139JR54_9MOLU|nr:DUF4194 domain-containing protein [Candidatus Phytoplasma oryzae]KXT29463.1 hypothetical protein AXA84_0109 [Candidatus Phytoplasma oryzae]RAM58042.1 hypothetical protein DH96_00620 [Candidatus Phytoplasma oryzae]
MNSLEKKDFSYTFVEKFEKLKEQEKKNFSRVVNKLLQVNFITIKKQKDFNDYNFIILYKDIFDFFFQLADFELKIKYDNEVIFIKSKQNFNKLKLNKEESLILLVICILFYQKKEFNTNNSIIEIYLQDIYKELGNIGYTEVKKMNKEKMKKNLMLLSRYNIIDFSDIHTINNDDISNNLIIKIYPTIIYVIDLEMAKQYQKLLNLNTNKEYE